MEKDGNKAEVKDDEKLKGHRNSVGDGPTVEAVKKVEEKGRKVKEDDPKWIEIAKKEIGVKEIKGAKDNERIVEYHNSTTFKASDDETPWCSSFVNWCITKAGYKGTNSAQAISWKRWGKKVDKPVYGCIVIIDYSYKGEKYKGKGHVGFAVGGDSELNLYLLGGNQSDSVKVSKYRCSSITKYVTYVVPEGYISRTELKPYEEKYDEGSYEATR